MNSTALHFLLSHTTIATLFAIAAGYGILKLAREIIAAVWAARTHRRTLGGRPAMLSHAASDELSRIAIH